MNISANTVIKKMQKEMEQLSSAHNNPEAINEAMKRIQLLSELWLEAYEDEQPVQKQEVLRDFKPSEWFQSDTRNVQLNEDDMSIFDF